MSLYISVPFYAFLYASFFTYLSVCVSFYMPAFMQESSYACLWKCAYLYGWVFIWLSACVWFHGPAYMRVSSSLSPLSLSLSLGGYAWVGMDVFIYIYIQNVLIIGRDMNAQTSNEENNEFSLHNLPNRNGRISHKFFTWEQSSMLKF